MIRRRGLDLAKENPGARPRSRLANTQEADPGRGLSFDNQGCFERARKA
jgi:hypothetical protein